MKKSLILLFITLLSGQMYSQRMETDIFGDPSYMSRDLKYKATLKKDIFDNLIFSDTKKNEVRYEKKYLDAYYPNVLSNEEAKYDLFRQLLSKFADDSGYKATYSIDIFDKVLIKDNRGLEVKAGKDMNNNPTYEERMDDKVKLSIKRDFFGGVECQSDLVQATLKKNVFNKWVYKDNSGNEFEFSPFTWRLMKDKFGSEEDVMMYLINEFATEARRRPYGRR